MKSPISQTPANVSNSYRCTLKGYISMLGDFQSVQVYEVQGFRYEDRGGRMGWTFGDERYEGWLVVNL